MGFTKFRNADKECHFDSYDHPFRHDLNDQFQFSGNELVGGVDRTVPFLVR